MIVDPRLYFQTTLLPVEASHTALGTCGELLVSRILCEHGYRQLQSHKHGDLTMADADGVILNIEVKTARQNKQGRYQFCIRKSGHTDAQDSDWTVLLAVPESGRPIPFVIPSIELTAKCVAIGTPHKYAGRLARYRQHIDSLSLSVGDANHDQPEDCAPLQRARPVCHSPHTTRQEPAYQLESLPIGTPYQR